MATIRLNDFDNIYNETYHTILRYIIGKCQNLDDVNEILQDSYVELYHTLQRKKALKLDDINAYLKGITKNIIKKFYRKKYKERSEVLYFANDLDYIDTKEEDEQDLEADFITRENVQQIWNYLNNKNVLIAKIFYLYFTLGLKISDIAIELELTESATKNYIYRTLKELKEVFGKEAQDYD